MADAADWASYDRPVLSMVVNTWYDVTKFRHVTLFIDGTGGAVTLQERESNAETVLVTGATYSGKATVLHEGSGQIRFTGAGGVVEAVAKTYDQ